MNQDARIEQLNSFDQETRRHALTELAADVAAGPPMDPPHVNMHCHTFYSYNGYDASPSRVAYEAYRQGWYATGTCDFDVLDSLAEFLAAGDLLQVRATVNCETRVFYPEYAEHVINSPGEPGVYYFMGAGFVHLPEPGTAAAAQLQKMRDGAERRNRDVVERVNAYLAPFSIDYDTVVLPLTPNRNATERHICAAYIDAAASEFDADQRAVFWADKLGIPIPELAGVLNDKMAFSDLLRSKLMKKGGPGYVTPTSETFPPLDDVIRFILDCRAVPMATWLDGTSSGEGDIVKLLEDQISKGVAALNIVPDRNWNIADPETAAHKIRKFHECVKAADRLNLPINVGTELNKFGQPWVDDFTASPMRAVAASLIQGAQVMVGHTRLLRYADFSYTDTKASAEFPEPSERNRFFAAVGALPAPDIATRTSLVEAEADVAYAQLRDAADAGCWSAL